MRLVFEAGDFPAHSGKKLEDLADPYYGFTVLIEQRPSQLAGAVIKQNGSGWRVEPGQLVVEIAGKERETMPARAAKAEKIEESKQPRRGKGGKFQKDENEPALTGPRLPDASDWLG